MRSTCLHSYACVAKAERNLLLAVLPGGIAPATMAGIYAGVGLECVRILFTQ